MHELSIAQCVLDTVRSEAEQRPGTRIRKVGLRVGPLSGVNADSLQFCFEALVKGTPLEALALEIECIPRRQRCEQCGTTFAVSAYELQCPACGRLETRFAGGDELEVAYLELEEL